MTTWRPAVTRLLGATVLLGLAMPCADVVRAEATAKKPMHRSQPARPAQTAPDRTGTIGKPADVAPTAVGPTAAPTNAGPRDEQTAALVPFYLPDVPRARVRACGESWRARKFAGETGDDNWRDFATKCLVAAEAPASP